MQDQRARVRTGRAPKLGEGLIVFDRRSAVARLCSIMPSRVLTFAVSR